MKNLHNLIENTTDSTLPVKDIRSAYAADKQAREKECADCRCPNCGLVNKEAEKAKRAKRISERRKSANKKFYQPDDDGWEFQYD